MTVAETMIDDEMGKCQLRDNTTESTLLIQWLFSSYMRDMRYESSGYGAPPPNYQMAPYGGDSYRPERDRDRDIPPSPSSHLPYYERDRLDDRDYYNRGPRISGPSSSIDYDRYRSSGRSRPSWGPSKMDDSRRMMDRDRPERISTNVEVRSGRTSPTSATASTAAAAVAVANPSVTKDRTSDVPKVDDKKKELEPRTSVESSNFLPYTVSLGINVLI